MKQNKNIFPSLSSAAALLIATMFASCTKAELEAPVVKQSAEIRFGIEKNIISKPLTKSGSESDSRVLVDYDPNDPNSIGLSMTVVDGIETPVSNLPATKGTQVTQKEQLTAFDVASYFFADAAAEDGSFVFEDIVSDGVNTTNKTYYWPSFGEMNFIATYPIGLFGENGIKSIADADGHLQSFSYTIPETVADQQDIMIAVTNDVDCTAGGQVPLQFKHLLSAVQFKVGKMVATRINSLTISGVKGGTVTMTYDAANDKWNYQASSNNVSYSPIYLVAEDTPNVDTYGMAEGNYITNNDNNLVMFVMPQTLDGATLSLSYTEQITGTTHNCDATLTGHSWEAGKTLTYVININAETLQITIPTPPDADAHYVRVDMEYDFSGINNFEGITVSNITAKASWLNDGSNTATADKQSIYLKKSVTNANGEVTSTELTKLQQDGYYTDELWEVRYSVNSSGDRNYSVGSESGPELVDANILGVEELNNLVGKGFIHLFLDENNGTTDRNGKVEISATVKESGKSPRTVVLGNGNFKQLCPSWNNNGIGVERFEDDDVYPYGFSYNRVVTYTNTKAETLESLIEGGGLGALIGIGYYIYLYLTGGIEEEVLPDTEGLAPDFVVKGDEYAGFTKSFTLNYGALNDIETTVNDNDGLVNTSLLYKFTGSTDLKELENQIDEALSGWDKTEVVTGSFPEDYAAYIALTRNRMREYYVRITSSQGTSETRKAILHKENEGDGTGGVNESGDDIIEWYLPSVVEAQSLYETGTGNETTPISPLNGIYWSSTAGSNPSSTSTYGFAGSYTYQNNEYSTSNMSQSRADNLKVRAVRKR